MLKRGLQNLLVVLWNSVSIKKIADKQKGMIFCTVTILFKNPFWKTFTAFMYNKMGFDPLSDGDEVASSRHINEINN